MSNTTSPILDTIRKLLALAHDSAATPGEVEAALGRAAYLQRMHGITDEAIRVHVHASSDGSVNIDWRAVAERQLFESLRKIGRWDAWIAQACARAVGAKTYHSHGHGKARIVVYGLPQDCAVACELYEFASSIMIRMRKAWCKANAVPLGSQDGKSWADGFCSGLLEAASKAAREAATDSAPVQAPATSSGGNPVAGSTALVLVSSSAVFVAKQHAVATYATTKLRLRSSGASYGVAQGSGYHAGRAAGAATNLSRRTIR